MVELWIPYLSSLETFIMNSNQTEQFPGSLPAFRRQLEAAGLAYATQVRGLTAADIEALLRSTPLQFIVFDLPHSKLKQIPVEQSQDFWGIYLKPRLVEPTGSLSDPYGCYQASEWRTANNELMILLIYFYWPV
jgi:hypothetical protein